MNTEKKFDTDPSLLKFAKGKSKEKKLDRVAVVYTRVSSKEQFMTNGSLDTQIKDIDKFAFNNKVNILGYFGGTFESAKTDGRKEFNRMLRFIKNNKNKVNTILVHSIDRFSRTGGEAIKIKNDLKAKGIELIAISQPVDTDTASGRLTQDVALLFANFDNEVRKDKCVGGSKNALESGRWIGSWPIGYTKPHKGRDVPLQISKDGPLIKSAFEWKAKGLTALEIQEKLALRGLKLRSQHLSEIFRNVFYCGFISHNLLDGRIVKGSHEPLISVELFKKVNDLLRTPKEGPKKPHESALVPLKGFLVCDCCGRPFTAYEASKRLVWYYKCPTKGCKVNISAKKINATFQSCLQKVTINKAYMPILHKLMVGQLKNSITDNEEAIKQLKIRLGKAKNDLESLERRYAVEGTVTAELFGKFAPKLKGEIEALEHEIATLSKYDSSNIKNQIDSVLEMLSNLSNSWASSDFGKQQKLQKLIFPNGWHINKNNMTVRTSESNKIFLWMARHQQDSEQKKTGIPEINLSYDGLVDPERFELSSK